MLEEVDVEALMLILESCTGHREELPAVARAQKAHWNASRTSPKTLGRPLTPSGKDEWGHLFPLEATNIINNNIWSFYGMLSASRVIYCNFAANSNRRDAFSLHHLFL